MWYWCCLDDFGLLNAMLWQCEKALARDRLTCSHALVQGANSGCTNASTRRHSFSCLACGHCSISPLDFQKAHSFFLLVKISSFRSLQFDRVIAAVTSVVFSAQHACQSWLQRTTLRMTTLTTSRNTSHCWDFPNSIFPGPLTTWSPGSMMRWCQNRCWMLVGPLTACSLFLMVPGPFSQWHSNFISFAARCKVCFVPWPPAGKRLDCRQVCWDYVISSSCEPTFVFGAASSMKHSLLLQAWDCSPPSFETRIACSFSLSYVFC